MSFYTAGQEECVDSDAVNVRDARNEKNRFTRIWVAKQRAWTDQCSDGEKVAGMICDESVSGSISPVFVRENKDGSVHEDEFQHVNGHHVRRGTSKDALLAGRRLKTEPLLPPDITNSGMTADIVELTLINKLEDRHLSNEVLKLPLLGKASLDHPTSPFASPRSSLHGGSDTSPASSLTDSPLPSPRGRLNRSLPRNFAVFKDHFENDAVVGASRSLPGSPIIRRSLAQKMSDSSDVSAGHHRPYIRGGHLTQSRDIVEDASGRRGSFSSSKDHNFLNTSSKFCSRRPGTPLARDLKPGMRIGQLSKSMSDLQAIEEASSGMRERRANQRVLPSIFNKI